MELKREWKEIKGYEGKYIISNYGEVLSLPRYKQNHSKKQYVKPKEILRYTSVSNGYVYVCLYDNSKFKSVRLHRLVAEAFLKKECGKEQINHIDGNKENNRVDNLEWCTAKENIIHAYKNGLASNKNKIIINQFDKNYNFIKQYSSISEANQKTGISISNISQCINGKRKSAGGYIWKYHN